MNILKQMCVHFEHDVFGIKLSVFKTELFSIF